MVKPRRSIHNNEELTIEESLSRNDIGPKYVNEGAQAELSDADVDDEEEETLNVQTQSTCTWQQEHCKSTRAKRKDKLLPDHSTTFGITGEGTKMGVICGVFLILVCVFASRMNSETATTTTTVNHITIADLRAQFPSQSRELWIALESGIHDTLMYSQPSVFLLLYKRSDRNTTHLLLEKVADYVSDLMRSDGDGAEKVVQDEKEMSRPIVLHGYDINTDETLKDYGYLIDKYKEELKVAHLMIVHDLDQVAAQVAQAFHTFCDQYSPLVGKSIFIFTLAVNNFDKAAHNDYSVVERVLSMKWASLRPDIFDPLLARLSNLILRVTPENNNY